MSYYEIAIRRSVLTVMMMVGLVIFGVLGYLELPISLLPSVDFPVVTVTTVLPGASPEVMESDVTDAVENAVNTIEGIDEITSFSGQGISQVTITFDLGRDIDIAAQDVRDKVSGAVGEMPLDAEPPIIQKLDINSQPMLWFALAGKDQLTLSDYVDQVVRPRLQSAPGVGNVFVGGFRERMVRIWIDSERLAAHGLTVNDVIAALERENLELPGGFIEGPRHELAVRNMGLFESIDDFNQMIITTVDGRPIRLSDVGSAQEGMADLRGTGRYNTRPSLGLGIAARAGANLVDVSAAARQRMAEISKDFPAGVTYAIAFDAAEFVEISIHNVQVDIIYGAVLAILVVFVFLRSWRSTFIVSLAIPTSLITTFGFMQAFGFSLNNLTTLALALSVGVVIDDAIVVLENIFRHQEEGEDPLTAAVAGTREIALAATAATLSIAAVFVPVAYTRGMVGQFLFEFGISVAIAILVSLFVALTLTPMLCAKLLRVKPKHGRIYELLEGGFRRMESAYSRALNVVLRSLSTKLIVIILATLMLGPIYFLGKVIGKEFAPSEDISMFMAQLEAPVGTSFEAMDDLLQQVENVILSQPEVYSGFAAIDLDDRGQVNTGVMFCQLIKPHLRQRSQHQLVADLRRELAEIKGVDARLIEFSFYNFGGEGGDFPVSYSIRGPDLEVLDTVGRKMMERLAEIKGVVDLDTNLDLEQPQVHLRVDRERAHDLGLDASTVFSTVYSLVAGREIGSYTSGGKRYEVHIKMLPSQIRTPEDIGALQIRTPQGRMVRLDSLIDLEYALGPININRTDRERSLLLQGNLEGVALGDVTGKIESILDEELPDGYTWRAAGQAEEMRQAGGSLIFAMALAVIIVYMLLASQFNSLIHPFTIMLALPPALLGALLALVATGSTLNIMSMIGIILLFGLVTKNSILLVDLTIQRQAAGLEADEALRVACPIRLRPILMTAVSMIFGVLPVALALGEGGEARAPMAIATAGGMTTSTLMTLFVVPVVYSLLESSTRLLRRGRREPIAEPAPDDNGSS